MTTLSDDDHDPTMRDRDPAVDVRDALLMVAGKWVPVLLGALAQGPKRNFQLRRAARGITPQALADSLRRMERDGLVTRTEHDDGMGPPGLGYSLTRLGSRAVGLLGLVSEWTDRNYPAIVASRAQHRHGRHCGSDPGSGRG